MPMNDRLTILEIVMLCPSDFCQWSGQLLDTDFDEECFHNECPKCGCRIEVDPSELVKLFLESRQESKDTDSNPGG